MPDEPARFDFDAYRRAFTAKDVDAWIGFYAEDAEWVEYKPAAPPRAPVVMSGREAIAEFLAGVAASDVVLEIEDEVVGRERAAFRVVCRLGDGRRDIEHVIVTIRDGRIVRQVEVEAWD
jgi:ketosteroid isomerase-like protein